MNRESRMRHSRSNIRPRYSNRSGNWSPGRTGRTWRIVAPRALMSINSTPRRPKAAESGASKLKRGERRSLASFSKVRGTRSRSTSNTHDVTMHLESCGPLHGPLARLPRRKSASLSSRQPKLRNQRGWMRETSCPLVPQAPRQNLNSANFRMRGEIRISAIPEMSSRLETVRNADALDDCSRLATRCFTARACPIQGWRADILVRCRRTFLSVG